MHIDNVSLNTGNPAAIRRTDAKTASSRVSSGLGFEMGNDRARTSGISRLAAIEIARMKSENNLRSEKVDRFRTLATDEMPRLADAEIDAILAKMTGRADSLDVG